MENLETINELMGQPPQKFVDMIQKNPQLAWNMYQTMVEVSSFFEDPTAKKEEMVGTRQLVDHCATYYL